ncbi:MAG: FAD-binding protein [SAR202 cluster bacterium]|jgi:glycolate oxidase|nr:FAD-binding protein [SAR202 cluster bacterium]|tara:strand:- start:381 stop:1817 length:1437 start_codon:yes stop_codon:yes gene_type:complete
MESLIKELRQALGRRYVMERPEELLVYEYDGSVERGAPQIVAVPADTEQVSRVVSIARKHGVPVVPRGAGTGLSGGAIPAKGGILMPLTRMNRILEIDAAERVAIVEPGVVNIDISKAAEPYGLRYAPDPSSQKACTIGGNVAENAGGPHCLAYGVTTNHVLGMETVLADGSVVWVGGRQHESIGYDLRGVLIGSEGTLAVTTKVAVRLQPLPEMVTTMLAIFQEEDEAGAAVSAIIASGIVPAAIEMMDKLTIQAVEPAIHAGYPADAGAVLLVEVEGLRESVAEEAAEVQEICRASSATEVRVADDPAERERLWAGRKTALGALGRLAPSYYLLDGVVPRSRVLDALRRIREISQEYGLPIANVFHAGDGNLHPCILFDERIPDELRRSKEAGGAILRACLDLGGALSGEHGVGLEKQEYMDLCFTNADLDAMARLNPGFASGETFNPGKIFPSGASCVELLQHPAIAKLGLDAFV